MDGAFRMDWGDIQEVELAGNGCVGGTVRRKRKMLRITPSYSDFYS